MTDKELKLNSVSRYSKQSPRLILEEYSHCEVPAGCGGAVLRWRNPNRDVPLTFEIFADTEKWQIFLDGSEFRSARSILQFGNHLVALKLEEIDPEYGSLLFLASYDEDDRSSAPPRVSRRSGVSVHIGSAADGSWKYTTADPNADWTALDYDDSSWASMIAKEMRQPEGDKDPRRYRLRQFKDKGVDPLGIQGEATTIWIRKHIAIRKDQGATSG